MNQTRLATPEIIATYLDGLKRAEAEFKRAQRKLEEAKLALEVGKQGGIRGIVGMVALAYGVSIEGILSKSRTRGYARKGHPDLITPRQVSMYISRVMTKRPWTFIGRMFKRDHSTIMHGYQKIKDMIEQDPAFKAKVESIMDSIREAAQPVADLAA